LLTFFSILGWKISGMTGGWTHNLRSKFSFRYLWSLSPGKPWAIVVSKFHSYFSNWYSLRPIVIGSGILTLSTSGIFHIWSWHLVGDLRVEVRTLANLATLNLGLPQKFTKKFIPIQNYSVHFIEKKISIKFTILFGFEMCFYLLSCLSRFAIL